MNNARNNRVEWLYTLASALMLALFLFPIYWMMATAVKPSTEIMAYPPQFIPARIDFSVWYDRLIGDPKIPRYFLNSAIIGGGTTLLTLALAAPAAYALAHLPIRGKSLLLVLSLTSLMFPAIMLATPLFVIFSRLRLLDSYTGLILANTTLALSFVLTVLRPFFLSIPIQLTEAARIDGASAWGAFMRIILPLATPGLFTTAVFTFLFGWSELVFALSLANQEQYRPVTAGLWHFIGSNVTQWNAVMAFSTLAMLPPLLVFLAAQRFIVSGLTSGAVK
jgi:multiple sugar transport system permease protein